MGNGRLEITAEQLCNLDHRFLVAVNIMYFKLGKRILAV